MLVAKATKVETFSGEDGEKLSIYAPRYIEDNGDRYVELTIVASLRQFRAKLNSDEASSLAEFLDGARLEDDAGMVVFSSTPGAKLVFRHTNRGEPFRTGIEIFVQDLGEFPDHLMPFIGRSQLDGLADTLCSFRRN